MALLEGAGVDPPGDLVMCDLAREGANHVIRGLRSLDLEDEGAIVIEDVLFSISAAAERAELDAPGLAGDAVVWEEVEARMRDEQALSASFVVFMIISVLIAGVGLLVDQPVLIVGAMVVGPDFSPLAAMSFWLFRRRPRRSAKAARTMLVGFAAGAGSAAAIGAVARSLGLVSDDLDPSELELTGFVFDSGVLAFVVALLAGTVGMLSFTEGRSGALVGVFISVTTIPALAGIGVSIAAGDFHDVAAAATQLFVNVVGLVTACVVTLYIQWRAWRRVAV